MRRLARRLGLRQYRANLTRFGDCADPFQTFDWEPDPRGEIR